VSSPADLFAALAGVPRLAGALCLGEHEPFGSDEPGDVEAAIELCSWCPAKAKCEAWADSLAPNSVSGVVAGRLYVWTQKSAPAQPRGRLAKTAAVA
jgi:hypothetical protein